MTWILFCVLQMSFLNWDFVKPLMKYSTSLHNCLVTVVDHRSGEMQWFYNAILFGEDRGIRSKTEIKVFMVLGLYHIIVVSGSHFIFLEKFLSKIFFLCSKKTKTFLIGLTLALFTMANQWQPACLRAYIHWILKTVFRYKLSHTADLQIMAICFCLLLKPALYKSLSFQLSCSAGLGLSIIESLRLKNHSSKILTAVLCVLLTTPLLFSIQSCLSWLVIPVNILALSVVEIVFLPLALTNFIFPFLIKWTEPILQSAFKISEVLSKNYQPELCISTERSSSWGMIYIAVLFLLWRLFLPLLLRREFMKSQTSR